MKRFLSLVTILMLVTGISFAQAGDKDKKTSVKSKSCCAEMTSAKASKDKDACCAEMTSATSKTDVSKSDVSMTTKAAAKGGCCAGTASKTKMSKEDCQKACPAMKTEKTTDAKGTTD